MREQPRRSQPAAHLPGIDGLRAIAVVGVLLYHGEIGGLLPGGFLGVDVFFTLSGFLITWLLVREFEGRGSISVRSFYVRRAKRLLPAALALLAVVVVAALLVAPDALGRLRGDVPAALTYTSNWWQIASGQSYFEMTGRPPLLQHLWSLAIEEQYYVLWPALVLLLLRLAGPRSLATVSALLALAATGWMAWLAVHRGYPAEADPSRVYLGTDTHTMGLLVGAAVGAIWRPSAGDSRPVPPGSWLSRSLPGVLALDLAGAIGVAAIVAVMARVHEATALLYRGGFLAFALLSAVVVVAVADPRTWTGRLLGKQPLLWIGQRSYGLYLWHWPIYCLLRPGHELADRPWAVLAFRLALTAVAAEVSYRVIEDPFRTGRAFAWDWPRRFALSAATGVAAFSITLLFVRPAAPIAPPPDVAQAMGLTRNTIAGVGTKPALAAPGPVDEEEDEDADDTSPRPVLRSDPSLPRPDEAGHVVTAVGDSVMLGAQSFFQRSFSGSNVDAEVGRQGSQGLARIKELRARGLLAPMVVVHLGTNGYLTESHLRALLTDLGDRDRVLLVNVHAPRRWTEHNNEMIVRVQADFPNVALVDWSAASEEHPEYFVSDGVHLTPGGMKAFVSRIGEAGGLAFRDGWDRATPYRARVKAQVQEEEADDGEEAEEAPSASDVGVSTSLDVPSPSGSAGDDRVSL